MINETRKWTVQQAKDLEQPEHSGETCIPRPLNLEHTAQFWLVRNPNAQRQGNDCRKAGNDQRISEGHELLSGGR